MSLVNPVKGKSSDSSSQQMTLMKAVLFVAKVQRWKNATNLPGDDIRMWLLILGRSLGLELENNIVKVRNDWLAALSVRSNRFDCSFEF